MNHHCIDLNLNIFPLNSKVNIESLTVSYQNFFPRYHLNTDLLRFLKSFGLEIGKAEMFYSLPGHFTPIHIDGEHEDIAKLNWAFCEGAHSMNWYKTNIQKTMKLSDHNTGYRGYELSEVELVHTQEVKFPSIVQGGVPHNVTNGEAPRRCLSAILRYVGTEKYPTMEEAIKLFSDYIVGPPAGIEPAFVA